MNHPPTAVGGIGAASYQPLGLEVAQHEAPELLAHRAYGDLTQRKPVFDPPLSTAPLPRLPAR
jgi:hypothetical protein